jgi:hypothetical protein
MGVAEGRDVGMVENATCLTRCGCTSSHIQALATTSCIRSPFDAAL